MDDERPASREWTPDEDKILDDMLHRGCSYGQIALELHRTRNSCISRARRLCIEVPPRDNRRARPPKKPKPLRQGPIAMSRMPAFPALPPPETSKDEIAPDALFKPLEELNRSTECHYPHGNNPFFFCAAPVVRGPYCAFHHKLTHSKMWR